MVLAAVDKHIDPRQEKTNAIHHRDTESTEKSGRETNSMENSYLQGCPG